MTLVGPLPRDLQKITTYSAAVSTQPPRPRRARAFIAFVTRPRSRRSSPPPVWTTASKEAQPLASRRFRRIAASRLSPPSHTRAGRRRLLVLEISRDAPMALVLSAGAPRRYEAGVAATFMERGLPIRLVAGSSAGALNAAMIASGRADRLEAMWRGVTREQIYTVRSPVILAASCRRLTLFVLKETSSLSTRRRSGT